MTTLRKQIGQLLIVGLSGPELTPLEGSWLKVIAPGGVILFRRNIEEAKQTYGLLAELSSFLPKPLFRCVDVEGGLVDRLRDLIAPMPSLAAVAASGRKSLYQRHGMLIGREAAALGFNAVFAPVLDLASPESQRVMRTRTFFSNSEELIKYAEAFLAGLKTAGVWGCGKHFPGLGGGTLDSHQATPVIHRDWKALWDNDLLPYRKLKSRLPIIMVSHASYPNSGDEKSASISRHWISEILIKQIGYRGLVVSDDMEMGGIISQSSIEDAAIAAVEAGTQLIEICKDPALVLRAYEALLVEAEKSLAFRRLVDAVCRKIVRAKKGLQNALLNTPPSLSQIEKIRSAVEAFRTRLPEPQTTVLP
jgi:beta-N-acetylhexosaminidase